MAIRHQKSEKKGRCPEACTPEAGGGAQMGAQREVPRGPGVVGPKNGYKTREKRTKGEGGVPRGRG